MRPSWVPEEASTSWAALASHCAPMLADCNASEAQLWGPWANSPAPEANLPPAAAAKLNAFQRLLLLQVGNQTHSDSWKMHSVAHRPESRVQAFLHFRVLWILAAGTQSLIPPSAFMVSACRQNCQGYLLCDAYAWYCQQRLA